MTSAIEAELEALCRSCGLCCDGSLFGCVTLEPDEIRSARANRLAVLPRENAFAQPCVALAPQGDERVCAAYAERPRACRDFACLLYERHRAEGGPLAERLAAVRSARELLAALEAMAEGEARSAAIAELTARMERDFARARPIG